MSRTTAAVVISILLAIAGYIAVIAWSGSETTWTTMRSMSLSAWLAVLGLSLANYLSRYARWDRYIRSLHRERVPAGTHVIIYFAGFALTTTPGKAGEAIRSVLLKRYYAVDYAKSLSALFVERLMDLLSVLIIVILVMPSMTDSNLRTAAVLLASIIIVTLPLLHHRGFLAALTRRARRLPGRVRRLALHTLALIKSSASLLKNRNLYTGLALGIAAWTFEGIGLYLIADALQLDIAVGTAIGIYGVATLIGALSMVPGGLGGTEISMVALLSAAGADHATATAATLICRIASLWFAVGLGFVSLAWLAQHGMRGSE